MALKDHITDSAKLSEEEIEAIIADFIKYDPAHKAVVFLPKAQELSAEKKIFLYLVALRGWQFVVEQNPPAANASPGEIERVTGIRGGTLRPLLRALALSRMLESKKGKYEILAHNLGRVREAITSGKTTLTSKPNSENKKSTKEVKQNSTQKSSQNKPSLAEAFEKLVKENWFGEGKTLIQLKEELEKKAVIVPTSHLPVHLLKVIREKNPRLTRDKKLIDGKKIWVYSSSNNN